MENSNQSNAEDLKSTRPKSPPPSTSAKQYLSRNPWLNFVSTYRKQHKNLSANNLIKTAAAVWRAMNPADKLPFIEEAKKQPPRNKRRRHRKSRKTRGEKPKAKRRSLSNASNSSSSFDKPIRERHFCCDSELLSSSDDD